MMKAFKIVGICVLLFLIVQISRMYFSGRQIPDFSYTGLDNKIYTKQDLPKSQIIFVYFSPECGFCEKAIIELSNLHKINKSVNFVLITSEKSNKIISKFIDKNNIGSLTKFIFKDTDDSFPFDFGLGFTYTTPTILLYNSRGDFIKEIKNYKEISSLKI